MAENYNVADFINVESPVKTEDVKLKRFKTPFKIKSLTAEDVSELRKEATRKTLNKKTHTYQPEMDQNKFEDLVMASSIVVPNLHDQKLQEHYTGLGDPAKVLGNMLTAGEYVELSQRVMDISGLNDSTDSSESLVTEVKN